MSVEFIYQRITQLRLKEEVSVRKVSEALLRAENYISNVENKKHLPSYEELFKICDFFGITVSEFFAGEIQDPTLLHTVYDEMKVLDIESLEALLTLVRKMKKPK